MNWYCFMDGNPARANLSPVISYLLEYNPQFAFKGDFQMLHMLVNEGCCLIKDILPAIKDICSRNKNITSIAYFRPAIYRRRDNRLLVEKAANEKLIKQDSAIDPYSRARIIAWKLSKKLHISERDEQFLQEYEKKHGIISL